MILTNEFVDKYDQLIRHILLKEFRVRKKDLDEYVSLVYERLLSTDSYNPELSNFTTWLKWSVIRSVVSNTRKKERRSQDALDHAVDLQVASSVIGDEDAGTVQDELDRVFLAADLSSRDINLIKDIHLKGYSYEEAAYRFGMDLEAVKKVLYRAMTALRSVAGKQ